MKLCLVTSALATAFLCGCASTEPKNPSHETGSPLLGQTCEVHQTERLPEAVRIVYGLFQFYLADIRAEEALFPNAWTFCRGGCTVGEQKSIEVRFCPKCREEEKKWCELSLMQRKAKAESLFLIAPP